MKLDELKLSIKEVLNKDVERALIKLKEVVLPTTKIYDQIILNLNKLNTLKKEVVSNTISFEERSIRQDRLTMSTLELINLLDRDSVDNEVWGFGKFLSELDVQIQEYQKYSEKYNSLKTWFIENAKRFDHEFIGDKIDVGESSERVISKRHDTKINCYGKLMQIVFFEKSISEYRHYNSSQQKEDYNAEGVQLRSVPKN